jgi:hypothetical protein
MQEHLSKLDVTQVKNQYCVEPDVLEYRRLCDQNLDLAMNTFKDSETVIRIVSTWMRISPKIMNVDTGPSESFARFYKSYAKDIIAGKFNYDNDGVHCPGFKYKKDISIRVYDRPSNA